MTAIFWVLLVGLQPSSGQVDIFAADELPTSLRDTLIQDQSKEQEDVELLDWPEESDPITQNESAPDSTEGLDTLGLSDSLGIDSEIMVARFKRENYYPVSDFYQNWSTERLKVYDNFVPAKFFGADTLMLDGLGDARFTPPVENVITSHFGPRWGRAHNGTDLDLEKGDEVQCAFDGVVRVARTVSGYGKLVIVRHLNGLETWYAHLSVISVKPGETIFSGDRIGAGGATGRATGTHLHFELRYKDHPFDSRKIIDWETGSLLDSMLVVDRSFFGFRNTDAPIHHHDHEEGDEHHHHDVLTQYHTIQKRDTLYALARRYGTTVSRLCELNNIKSSSVLRIGQKILIQ